MKQLSQVAKFLPLDAQDQDLLIGLNRQGKKKEEDSKKAPE